MSLHAHVLILKTNNDEIRKCTYFTALDNCDQDLVDTLCITDHVLCEMKKDVPDLQTLYRKSYNADCYAGNSVAEIEYSLCKKYDTNLLRHDYNEPQCGKDQADRDSAVAKKFLNAYIHSGNDCSSANDIQKGILHNGGSNNLTVSVAETDKLASQMSQSKIRNIHSYHSVSFNERCVTFWQYFQCGNGKNVDYSELTFKSGLIALVPFKSSIQQTGTFSSKKHLDRDSCNLYFCTKTRCIDTFSSQEELEMYLLQGTHSFASKTTSMDIVKNDFAELVHQGSHKITGSIDQPTSSGSAERTILLNKFEKHGWALPK